MKPYRFAYRALRIQRFPSCSLVVASFVALLTLQLYTISKVYDGYIYIYIYIHIWVYIYINAVHLQLIFTDQQKKQLFLAQLFHDSKLWSNEDMFLVPEN